VGSGGEKGKKGVREWHVGPACLNCSKTCSGAARVRFQKLRGHLCLLLVMRYHSWTRSRVEVPRIDLGKGVREWHMGPACLNRSKTRSGAARVWFQQLRSHPCLVLEMRYHSWTWSRVEVPPIDFFLS
jgi:hypothetical protein